MTLPTLQEAPSALGSLVQGLGVGMQQSLPSINEMILNRQKNKQQQDFLSRFSGQLSGGLSGQGEATGIADPMQMLIGLHGAGLGEIANSIAPFLLSEHKQNLQQQQKQREEQESREHVGGILDELEANKEYVGSTKVPWSKSFQGQPGGLNRAAVQKRKYIDTLAFDIERILRRENTKGTLGKQVFQTLLEKIPSSEDSEREFQGKIDAFRHTLQALPAKQRKEIEKRLDMQEGKAKSENRPSLEEIFG